MSKVKCDGCAKWFDNCDIKTKRTHNGLSVIEIKTCQSCYDDDVFEICGSCCSLISKIIEKDTLIYCEDTEEYFCNDGCGFECDKCHTVYPWDDLTELDDHDEYEVLCCECIEGEINE